MRVSVARLGYVAAVVAVGFAVAGACQAVFPANAAPTASDDGTLRTAPLPVNVAANIAPVQKPLLEKRPCPDEMALIESGKERYCIDRWEASLVRTAENGRKRSWPGNHAIDEEPEGFVAVSVSRRKPQGYISGRQAADACERADKRLCSLAEWRRACSGPSGHKYPYGSKRQPNVCNDRFKVLDRHPVVRLFREEAEPGLSSSAMWTRRFMNHPRLHELSDSVVESGNFESCTNEYGVFDMVGNLHEWVDDPAGTFAGGFFMDTFQNGEGCEYVTKGHSFDYHDYSTGFRCCRSAGE